MRLDLPSPRAGRAGLRARRAGHAVLIQRKGESDDRAVTFAEGLAADPQHRLVVVDLPSDALDDEWESVVRALPRDNSGLRLVFGRGSVAEIRRAGQRIADRTGKVVLAADGALRPVPGGGLFVPPDRGIGWVRYRPSRAAAFDSRRFPKPRWEYAVSDAAWKAGSHALVEPTPSGLWLHGAGESDDRREGTHWVVARIPGSVDMLTVALGTPGGLPVELSDAVKLWRNVLPSARAWVRFLHLGPVALPEGVASVGQGLADSVNEQVVFYTGLPVRSLRVDDPPDVSVPTRNGTAAWLPFTGELLYRPSTGDIPAVPSLRGVRAPLDGLPEESAGVFAYTHDTVLEVIQSGVWLRPSGATEGGHADRVRQLASAPGRGAILYDRGAPDSEERMRYLAEAMFRQLEPTSRDSFRVAPDDVPGPALGWGEEWWSAREPAARGGALWSVRTPHQSDRHSAPRPAEGTVDESRTQSPAATPPRDDAAPSPVMPTGPTPPVGSPGTEAPVRARRTERSGGAEVPRESFRPSTETSLPQPSATRTATGAAAPSAEPETAAPNDAVGIRAGVAVPSPPPYPPSVAIDVAAHTTTADRPLGTPQRGEPVPAAPSPESSSPRPPAHPPAEPPLPPIATTGAVSPPRPVDRTEPTVPRAPSAAWTSRVPPPAVGLRSAPPRIRLETEEAAAAGPAREESGQKAAPTGNTRSIASQARPTPRSVHVQPVPVPAASAVAPERGLAEERAWVRKVFSAQYNAVAGSVSRVISQSPGLRGTSREDAADALTDLVSVQLYLTGNGRQVDDAVRQATPGPHVPLARCIAAGLHRLPSFRGAVFLRAAAGDAELRWFHEGRLTTEWAFCGARTSALRDTDAKDSADFLIWSMTARRTNLLDRSVPNRVLFLPGTSFKVLRTDRDGRRPAVLLREVSPAEITTGGVDAQRVPLDEIALAGLSRAAELADPEKASASVDGPLAVPPGLVRTSHDAPHSASATRRPGKKADT